MYMDTWISVPKSTPIDIPKNKSLKIQTDSIEVKVLPSSMYDDICTGYVCNTPPTYKHYAKGDKVMFHKDSIIESPEQEKLTISKTFKNNNTDNIK